MISGCLDSVLGQQGEFSVEILVHDDASTDASADIVARDYPEVRLIRSASNVGFCISNNRMLAEAKGDYVLLLNNDAELLPDAMHELVKAACELGQPAILSLPQYDYSSGHLIDRGCLLDPFFNPVPNLDPQRQNVAMVIGACLWLPKEMWTEMGGFPEWFGSIAEDMYLCCRARLAGYEVRALDISGYRHRVGRSFGGAFPRSGVLVTTVRRRALSERNKTFVMAMTCPAPFMQLLLPIHLALLLAEGLVLSILKRRFTYLREIYWPVMLAVLDRRKVLFAERTLIMRTRRRRGTAFLAAFDVLPYKLRMLLRHGLPNVN